jgi:hypothetical protein
MARRRSPRHCNGHQKPRPTTGNPNFKLLRSRPLVPQPVSISPESAQTERNNPSKALPLDSVRTTIHGELISEVLPRCGSHVEPSAARLHPGPEAVL